MLGRIPQTLKGLAHWITQDSPDFGQPCSLLRWLRTRRIVHPNSTLARWVCGSVFGLCVLATPALTQTQNEIASRSFFAKQHFGFFGGFNAEHLSNRLDYACSDSLAMCRKYVQDFEIIQPTNAVLLIDSVRELTMDDKQFLVWFRKAGGTVDTNCTAQDFEFCWEKFVTRSRLGAREGSLVLVHLSGHGHETGGVAILTVPPKAIHSSDSISISKMSEDLLSLSAASSRLLLIDACRFSAAKGPDTQTSVGRGRFLSALEATRGWVVFASCSTNQASFESSEFRRGLFTHFYLEYVDGKLSNPTAELITLNSIAPDIAASVRAAAQKTNFRPQEPVAMCLAEALKVPVGIPRNSQQAIERQHRRRRLALDLLEQFELRKLLSRQTIDRAKTLLEHYAFARPSLFPSLVARIEWLDAVKDTETADSFEAAVRAMEADVAQNSGFIPGNQNKQARKVSAFLGAGSVGFQIVGKKVPDPLTRSILECCFEKVPALAPDELAQAAFHCLEQDTKSYGNLNLPDGSQQWVRLSHCDALKESLAHNLSLLPIMLIRLSVSLTAKHAINPDLNGRVILEYSGSCGLMQADGRVSSVDFQNRVTLTNRHTLTIERDRKYSLAEWPHVALWNGAPEITEAIAASIKAKGPIVEGIVRANVMGGR